MEYLIILLGLLCISLALEKKFHMKLYKSKRERERERERVIIPLIFLVIAIIWDSFTIWRGHWSFEGSGLVGIKIGLMPLEEYLFALIIPYFILTSYNALKKEI
ncbi:MAG: lycopene cyclase domain-containing protein [Nanoarchaeota archaeon]|mgnify:CR=1 FL=1